MKTWKVELTVTEAMANIGSDLEGLSARIEGINESWINLSEMNTITNNSGSSIFLGELKSDTNKYLFLMNTPQLAAWVRRRSFTNYIY